VQVLYDFKDRDTGDESALKLTIAQYLTPGDVSIQEVGIVPDIELVPARILKERIEPVRAAQDVPRGRLRQALLQWLRPRRGAGQGRP